MFTLPSACRRIRSALRAPFRVHSFLGFSGFSALLHAARRLPALRSSPRRGSAVGRWKAYAEPSVHACVRFRMLFLARWARRLSWKEIRFADPRLRVLRTFRTAE